MFEVMLSNSFPLFSCFGVPIYCLLVILWDSFPSIIHTSKITLSISMSLFSCFGVPVYSLRVIRWDLFFSIIIHKPKMKLRISISLFSCFGEPISFLLVILWYSVATTIHQPKISLSSSICFEQSYDGVDGDSASSTEVYCLLSSLARIPINQSIAVTGSMNQHGMVQPIGGVNEKIEGFYHVCKVKGLTGKQGVMIPESNIRHLMLKDEVIEAVKNKKFHIWAVSTVDEGIEILTGKKAGVRDKSGKYPKGTINYLVDKKLKEYSENFTKLGKKKRPAKAKKKK